jgi:hypothetical protein
VPFLPSPTCPACAEGMLLQAAGAWPAGVPFCPEHELRDDGPGGGEAEVSGRRGLVAVLLRRWQLRSGERLFGWAVPLLFVALALVGVARAAVAWPRTSGTLAVLFTLGWLFAAYRAATVTTGVAVYAAAYLWAWFAPGSFRRLIGARALAGWRSVFVYRRRWRAAMRAADLVRADPDTGEVLVPRLRRVRYLPDVDVVHVRALLGQRGAAWEEAGPMLAHVFGARDVRVHRGDDRRLTLELLRGRRGRSWNRDGVLDLEGVRS